MADIAQIALEFCREVLGWADAYHSGDGYIVSRGRNSVWTPGNTSDLNVVSRHVHSWCKEHGCKWGAVGNSQHGQLEYIGYVLPNDDNWEGRSESADNPCHALLAACVEASRKLKQDAAYSE